MMFCTCWCGHTFQFEPDEVIVICPECLCFHDDLPPESGRADEDED